MARPFHLAIPVENLQRAREFYTRVLGLVEGRSDTKWVDLDFFGHQLVIHETGEKVNDGACNPVDGKSVPVPHFGVVLAVEQFKELAEKVKGQVEFEIEPYVRFEGEPGEQWTMFFRDTEGHALEFKAFADDGQLFAT